MRLRRTFTLALTGALSVTAMAVTPMAVAPMAALADTYPAPEVPSVSTSLPGTDAVLGDPFTMSIAAEDGSEVVLTITHDEAPDDAIQIAGVASHAKIAQGGGSTFYVTLHHEGTFTLVATVDGEVVATHAITVVDSTDASAAGDAYADVDSGVAADGDGANGGSSDGDGTGGAQSSALDQLATTGTEAAFLGLGALLLLGAGTAVLVAARRRSRA